MSSVPPSGAPSRDAEPAGEASGVDLASLVSERAASCSMPWRYDQPEK
jgi:hypothetical protein